LQTQFGYTLDQKAGGDDPLADFLFNVREGHCEYFATAMALMLRSQGIATRVVTGFQQGEYNETADVFVVRQRHAHAWVEVYFPGQEAWVSFDPTPAAGQGGEFARTGITNRVTKYLEALEMFWIQYFVAFDNQEQRSLFTNLRRGFLDYQASTSNYLEMMGIMVAEWWKDVQGQNGFRTRVSAIGYATAAAVFVAAFLIGLWFALKQLKKLDLWNRLKRWFAPNPKRTVVEFYERMIGLLEKKGIARLPHQTPLEFATDTGMTEVLFITEEYNRVRFGKADVRSREDDIRRAFEGLLARFN
jgi:hypothetical protein